MRQHKPQPYTWWLILRFGDAIWIPDSHMLRVNWKNSLRSPSLSRHYSWICRDTEEIPDSLTRSTFETADCWECFLETWTVYFPAGDKWIPKWLVRPITYLREGEDWSNYTLQQSSPWDWNLINATRGRVQAAAETVNEASKSIYNRPSSFTQTVTILVFWKPPVQIPGVKQDVQGFVDFLYHSNSIWQRAHRSRCSVQAAGWTIHGSNLGRGKGFISSAKCPHRFWGPSILLLNGYRGSFLGVKRPRINTDHSPPPRAKDKNECSYTSIPRINSMAWTVKT
jgi:hypothetical protein